MDAVGLGGHEEDAYETKQMHGFGDKTNAVPYVNFMPKAPPVPRGMKEDLPTFSTALLPAPRFIQTQRILSPRKKEELFEKHSLSTHGKLDTVVLAQAAPQVRQLISNSGIGPSNPSTKHLTMGALTFSETGPLISPRRTHLLAFDKNRFTGNDVVDWRSPKGSQTQRNLGRPPMDKMKPMLTPTVPTPPRTAKSTSSRNQY